MPEQLFQTITLLEKQTIAKDIIELRFSKPAGFAFLPGQFVQFKIPDGAGHVLRSYSISSAPHETYLEFCVKDLQSLGGKASKFFARLSINDQAHIGEPRGRFVCADPRSSVYFVATGTGLAPVKSIVAHLTSMLAFPKSVKLNLLFGVRTQADIFWHQELTSYSARYPAFSFATTLSKAEDSWTGKRGRVTDHLAVDLAGHYYICGSAEMVKDIRSKLTQHGLPLSQIHFEIF